MIIRRSLLVIALLLVAFSLHAECVDCWVGPCTIAYSDGTSRTIDETPYCGGAAADKGYEDCRNVGDCRGCIGWTCVTRDPESMSVVQRETDKALRLVRTEVTHTPARAH